MKVMLIWPTGAPEVKVLLNEIERAGHVIVYWVGEHPAAHLCPPSAVFHDHYDAWDAKLAESWREPVVPPSEQLISSMYETESLILTMMNKRYDSAPVDERKHIYYTMLAYWSAVLDRLQPEAIIFNDIPHSLYSNVLWDLARKRGIRSVMFEGTLVAGRVVRYEDIWKGSEELARAVRENIQKKLTPHALGTEMRAYWDEVTKRGNAPIWYIKQQSSYTRGKGLIQIRIRAALRALRSGTFLKLAWGFVRRLFLRDLEDEYREVVKLPNLSKPFVFFALNFQPERTTSPQGGIYHDQILAAETLAAALPEGWELYVKEHPSQWLLRGKTRYTSARYRGYYRRLAAIPRVRVVPIGMMPRELVDSAKAVATITGSIGIESIIWGKNVLTFGAAWYRDCPGVVCVKSVEDCERAFAEIAKSTKNEDMYALAFLKALEEVGVRTNVGDKELRMGNEETMRAFARSALDLLRNR